MCPVLLWLFAVSYTCSSVQGIQHSNHKYSGEDEETSQYHLQVATTEFLQSQLLPGPEEQFDGNANNTGTIERSGNADINEGYPFKDTISSEDIVGSVPKDFIHVEKAQVHEIALHEPQIDVPKSVEGYQVVEVTAQPTDNSVQSTNAAIDESISFQYPFHRHNFDPDTQKSLFMNTQTTDETIKGTKVTGKSVKFPPPAARPVRGYYRPPGFRHRDKSVGYKHTHVGAQELLYGPLVHRDNLGYDDAMGRVRIQIYRGPNLKMGYKHFAQWGYYVSQPASPYRRTNGGHHGRQ